MLKVYKRTWQFTIDGKCILREWSVPFIAYEGDQMEEMVLRGKTFQSLWEVMDEFGLCVPANRWNRAFWSNKRRIEKQNY